MSIIEVKDLEKVYKTSDKESGIIGYVKHLFHPKYKEFKAVKGVSFNIEEGELVSLVLLCSSFTFIVSSFSCKSISTNRKISSELVIHSTPFRL